MKIVPSARHRHAPVSFVKVKGHALDRDVEQGLVEAIDKVGNDGADALATAAADAHAAPRLLLQLAAQRRAMARAMDTMKLRILACRRSTEIRLGLAAPLQCDIGSCSVPGDTG